MSEGVFDGIPEDEYHADKGSLSVSGAKLLLPPSVPALFKYQRDHGQPHKAVFDFGSAAHKAVLGVGQPVRYIDADSWRTNKAKAGQAEAYALGEIPLLIQDQGVIEGMVAALREHPLASALLDPASGVPEQSLYTVDPMTGVRLRGRLDWLPTVGYRSRLMVADYKTTVNANPAEFGRTAAKFSYHQQAAWYQNLCIALGLDDDPAFLFLCQEKSPPYLVSVVELDADALSVGQDLNYQAISIYSECMERDEWPGYDQGVSLASLPFWYTKNLREAA